MSEKPGLAALIDNTPLPEEEARALWKEFSEHMDANKGDRLGFAQKKGFLSIAPELRKGQAVLVARTTNTPPPARAATPNGVKPQAGKRRKR
jgi:hypothetical protein